MEWIDIDGVLAGMPSSTLYFKNCECSQDCILTFNFFFGH